MEIRPLLPPPWLLLAPLIEASREEGFQFLIRLEHEFLAGKVRFEAAGETLLGAFNASTLIGVGGLTRDPYGNDPLAGRVRHLYVLPKWCHQGVGRNILGPIENHAQSRFNALVLRTDTKSAASFYEAFGYEQLPIGGTASHLRTLTAGVI